MEEGKSSCICYPAALCFSLCSLLFLFGVYFLEQTTSLGLVCCREQVGCPVLALRGVSVVTLQPVKQSTRMLRREEQCFLWVKVLAQTFD